MPTITTVSGAVRELPPNLDPARVAGLDEEGRIVVDDFGARKAVAAGDYKPGDWASGPFLFGLTLCCNAYDKGCEDGVFCRACYGSAPAPDAGNYLFAVADGSFPGLDPIGV